jgi:SAM-dependent methyltransferase
MIFEHIRRMVSKKKDKYMAEVAFWEKEIDNYVKWYKGELSEHYLTPSPQEDQKVKAHTDSHSAILTWLVLHQQIKYLKDLMLDKSAFSGLRVLDIGSGPMPSAQVFEGCDIYCLDSLLPEYLNIGFPIHYYERVKFIHGFAEEIPVQDNFFDAAISVNAFDHLDDIQRTSLEIKRVLKSGGKLRIHTHYHKATETEPLELSDNLMVEVFDWCDSFRKIKESRTKTGALAGIDEIFVLWSNF